MRADLECQAGRNTLIGQIKEDVQTSYATRKAADDERYYTKHTLLAPGADPANAVVAKAAWLYERVPPEEEAGRLTTLIPSQYSTDEDEETLKELKRRNPTGSKGKKP